MEYRNLITKFAESVGIKDLVFDEEGVARLIADDIELAFMEIPERHSVLLWSKVATPPPEHLEELYRALLEVSFMGRGTHGAAFSLEQGHVYLHRIDALVSLDLNSFTNIIEDFINLVVTYRQMIEEFRADHADKAARKHEEHHISGFGHFDFVHV